MKWYIDALRNYFNFNGRAGRKAYWMFVLVSFLFTCLAVMIDNLLGTTGVGYMFWGIEYGAFYNFYSLLILIPSLAVLVRRLHDVGKRGTWFFIVLIPVIGAFWLLFLLLKDSDPFDNEFGPVPPE